MEGNPAHLPFTFVHFGGMPASHQGMQAIICGRYLYKILLKSHNDKT